MKILFIGESWHIHMIHTKGYDSFTSSRYEEGATFLLDCLKKAAIDITYMPAHEVLINFPTSLQELNQYDAIVISDIGSNTFLLPNNTFYGLEKTPNALNLIKEYTQNGGGLLMIGGYLTFMGIEGKGNWRNSQLADALPIEMFPHDDRVECPEGIRPKTVLNNHTLLKNISDNWPIFLGYNKVMAKQKAETVVEINGDPLIVVGKYQKGRVACFTSDCAPHWGSPQFLQWESYSQLWLNILQAISKTE
ncbi:glutamine amidotransferase [Orbus sturtevantii]|uniref:glutamine amidotransferase n=1 Tax=Orbus sturtevantii TaxID=3074109 RepID=UPI00370D9A50